MIIDERTGIDADAGEASARALQRGLPRGMWHIMSRRDVATASRDFSRRYGWLWSRGYAVSIESEDISLAGVASHEAAIAKVEQHLHGRGVIKAPADPLCQRRADLP